ncbi:MAG: hypothetical protein LAP61_03485 [Acidobacteriia bacterium]|nr:hypothetical protein [Terriglobia bacterium]
MKQWIALPAILLPLIAVGQLQTPAEQAQVALRARVTEFLQYHVDGNFRKAYDMVADDTKDDYFNSGKAQLESFKIDDVKLNGDFTKATVTATLSKMMMIAGQVIPMTAPSITTWKIENGKWVWYNDSKAGLGNPMAVGLPPPPASATPQSNSDNNGGLPKSFDEKAILAEAQSILQQVGVDKKEVMLATDKPSEDKVVFHNGMPGSVQLELDAPQVPGLTAKLEKSAVAASGNVQVVFHYEPGKTAGPKNSITVQLVVQPLNQVFPIRVNFYAGGPVAPK